MSDLIAHQSFRVHITYTGVSCFNFLLTVDLLFPPSKDGVSEVGGIRESSQDSPKSQGVGAVFANTTYGCIKKA